MATQPILFLNIEQGPKAGNGLECKAAAIATVGRARASTLQISRDSGISQKHLCFQWRDDDDAHVGWTAMDAGSSNGTIINGVLVEPHKRVYIHTGDLIKIGSVTTIRVEILGVADEVMAVPKVKECSQRKGTCIASESHGKDMTGVAGRRHARKAGKALDAQECQGKQQDVMEGKVYHGKHNVVEGHGNQKDGMADEVHHGKQHSNISEGEGHGKQQESTSRDHEHEAENVTAASADIDLSMTVEQWFQHLMEEGPKYLYQVSESIIQELMLESKQFDEYALSLS